MPVVSDISRRRVALPPETPGLIAAVAEGSLAGSLGLAAGDRVVSVNGRTPDDALDFQFHAQSATVTLAVHRDEVETTFQLDLEGDEFWGITFTDPTFDGVRVCENACPFCFIKQIPKGMRRSLYVMDDDYRYSMLYGSFVTLTNLTEDDWLRIEEQRVSPMHVSVHATDPDLRVALVGNPKGAFVMDHLARLQRAGIDFHAQLVLCPGVNDGEEMDRSLRDLSSFGPRLLSIAAVPVGLTKHGQERQSKQVRMSRTCMRLLPGKQIAVRRYEPDEVGAVIDQSEAWQDRFRRERGETFFHLGDEFYLMAGREVPPASRYDGFPQIEDGIGITRHFLEDARRYLRRTRPDALAGARGTVACGTLIYPTMRAEVARFNARTGAELETVSVENRYLGREITVSGLLTGSDLIAEFEGSGGNAPLFISSRMISDRTGTLLDDLTLDDVSGRLGRPVIPAGTMGEVARALRANRPARLSQVA